MERLQGPINSSFFGEHLDVDFLEQGLTSTGNLRFEEEEAHFLTPGLDDTMPFLQMLQSVATPPFLPMKEPSFQTLLKLQHLQKPWEIDSQIQALELESCVTHDIAELHSPIKSEAKDHYHLHSISGFEGVSSQCHQELPSSLENTYREDNFGSNPTWVHTQTTKTKQTPIVSKASPATRERKKRKRTRPTKNKEEVESQRMTHIAVERNRRRQMNDHLNVLRSLMPTSYIQRGDQASIVGGAIDFVKELEQLLQSLEAQKRKAEGGENCVSSSSSSAAATAAATSLAMPLNGMFMSLSQYKIGSEEGSHSLGDEVWAENKSEAADIEVTVIQTHVNLKIQCRRRPGQLLKAIVALEELRLTILHLNITTSQTTVFYSVNLKIEDGCKLGSADEIAGAVHQIFRFIDST